MNQRDMARQLLTPLRLISRMNFSLKNYSGELLNLTGTVGKVELISAFTTAVCKSLNVSDEYTWDNAEDLKVDSHDPISVELSLKSLLCMIENVGVHTIQFSQPIIWRCTSEKHDNSCFENLCPFHHSKVQQWRPFCKNILQNRAWENKKLAAYLI